MQHHLPLPAAGDEVLWTHVATDLLIGLAYIAISLSLVYLVLKGRREFPFQTMFLAFGVVALWVWRQLGRAPETPPDGTSWLQAGAAWARDGHELLELLGQGRAGLPHQGPELELQVFDTRDGSPQAVSRALTPGLELAFEPELSLVLEDDEGVCGYALAAFDSRAFYDRYEREWRPDLCARYPAPQGARPGPPRDCPQLPAQSPPPQSLPLTMPPTDDSTTRSRYVVDLSRTRDPGRWNSGGAAGTQSATLAAGPNWAALPPRSASLRSSTR